MNNRTYNHVRILAVAPSTRGFGFAVFDGHGTLVDWGVKTVSGDKNKGCLAKVRDMITHYEPGVVVLEDCTGTRRYPRIHALGRKIVALAAELETPTAVLSRSRVRQAVIADGEGTRQEMAEAIASRYPEELGSRLPAKRRAWESEATRMSIFDAVALAVALREPTKSRD